MRHLRGRCRAAALAAVLVAITGGAGTESKADDPRQNPTVKAVQKVKPSVVAVKVNKEVAPGRSKELVGTGLIVDERGYVITNRHVIAGGSRVVVRLVDDTDLPAQVVASDPTTDLAILKVKAAKPLQAQPLGSAADLQEGEDVIAVGHPYGYSYTVSKGIVSALGRKVAMPTGTTLTGLIQTDASINPGNSGGPLLNIHGAVIGINVALREDAQGIAFAIPSETVRWMLSKHLSAQKVAGVEHGLSCQDQAPTRSLRGPQVVVVAVEHASVDAGAQVKAGDVILAVGKVAIASRFDVERALWDARPGETVPLRVLRKGQEIVVNLPLRKTAEASKVTASR
jgi:serine protease Do